MEAVYRPTNLEFLASYRHVIDNGLEYPRVNGPK